VKVLFNTAWVLISIREKSNDKNHFQHDDHSQFSETKEIVLKNLNNGEKLNGELQIVSFNNLRKIDLKGKHNKWGGLTKIVIKNCPNLVDLDFSYNQINEVGFENCPKISGFNFSNNKVEELAKFKACNLDYSIVSYIGSIDNDELFEQLKESLPGKKHEGLRRLCFGCLTEGGHQNKKDYHYYSEVELTKGGTLEYGVTANNNQRETCEIPEEGGLLIIDIDSNNDGVIKVIRRESENKKLFDDNSDKNGYLSTNDILKNKEIELEQLRFKVKTLEEQVGEVGKSLVNSDLELKKRENESNDLKNRIKDFQDKKGSLEETIAKLQEQLNSEAVKNDDQWRKQLEAGKMDAEKKLAGVKQKLEDNEKQKEKMIKEFTEYYQRTLEEFKSCEKKLQDEKDNYSKRLNEAEKYSDISLGGLARVGFSGVGKIFGWKNSYEKKMWGKH